MTATLWVSAIVKAINHLFFAGWTGRFVAVFCLAHPLTVARSNSVCWPSCDGELLGATVPGIGANRFFLITLLHVSHASVRRLENGVSPQGNRTRCTSRSLGPLPHGEISWTFLCFRTCQCPWHSNVVLTSFSVSIRLLQAWLPVGRRSASLWQQCQAKCILVFHVDRVWHQEEGTSLRDESVILIAWSAWALSLGALILRHAVFGCLKPLVHPFDAHYHGNQDCPT